MVDTAVSPDAVNVALLTVRVAVGAMIVAHGYNHIWGGGGLAGTAGWFESMGLRPGRLHAVVASVTELLAGVALVLGVAVPLAAGAVLGVMVVAWLTAHRTNGFFIFRPGQGWEYVMVVSAVCVAIGTVGPGQWSLDDALGWGLSGWWPLVVTLVVGVGGSFGLLAAFWRPGRTGAG